MKSNGKYGFLKIIANTVYAIDLHEYPYRFIFTMWYIARGAEQMRDFYTAMRGV